MHGRCCMVRGPEVEAINHINANQVEYKTRASVDLQRDESMITWEKSRKNLHLSSLVSFLFPSIPQGLSVTPLSAVIKHCRLVFLVISGHLQIVLVTLKEKHTHQPIKESRFATITHTDISKADVRNTVFLLLLGWEYTSNIVDFLQETLCCLTIFREKATT